MSLRLLFLDGGCTTVPLPERNLQSGLKIILGASVQNFPRIILTQASLKYEVFMV